MKKLTAIGLCLLTLTGCAPHWSRQDCQMNDLYTTGITDGRSGLSLNQFGRYQSDCARFKIDLVEGRYNHGWKKGNRDYCLKNNLYQIGKQGKAYPLVCPNSPTRMVQYQKGVNIYNRIQSTHAQINAISNQLNQTQHLENQYQTIVNKMNQDRQDMHNYKRGDYYDNAHNDFRQQRQELSLVKMKLSASIMGDQINAPHRNKLSRQREALNRQLIQLQNT